MGRTGEVVRAVLHEHGRVPGRVGSAPGGVVRVRGRRCGGGRRRRRRRPHDWSPVQLAHPIDKTRALSPAIWRSESDGRGAV